MMSGPDLRLSDMAVSRFLIVNADDFGLNRGVNQGIIEAHEHGIVTSASLMVRWPAAGETVSFCREHPGLSLGLHIDLGEWIYCDGDWVPLYEVVPLDDMVALAAEVSRQLDIFRNLVGRDPTHIDSHQNVHLREPVRSVLIEVARELAVPVRYCNPEIHYCGKFYGQTGEGSPLPDFISVDGLIKILAILSPGITELGCHPGKGTDFVSTYRDERAQELTVLCDQRVRIAITNIGIELCSFGDVATRRM